MKLGFSILRFVCVVISILAFACDPITIPDDETDIITIINTGENTVPDSIKGKLVLHENFQKWNRMGYYSATRQNCETDQMSSTKIVSYFPTNLSVVYDSLSIDYSLIDFAVNPDCGSIDGSSTENSDVSTGYIALQCPIYYTCNHYSKGYIITSPIQSVSYIEFSVSYPYDAENNYAAGISLWKKGDADADTIKVGTYIPGNPLKGETFTVKINSENVVFKIKSEKNSSLSIATEDNINREVRIHDLKIWSNKE